jgi:uncharacterized membrane protein YhaH (DUF805 family)
LETINLPRLQPVHRLESNVWPVDPKGCANIGFPVRFQCRLGRLHYFLSTIGLAVVMTAVWFAIASYAIQNTPRGMDPSANLIGWPVIVSIVVFMWVTFTLQCMRVREIGWDPVCVIPAWVAILIIDKLVAINIPTWSLGSEHNGTIVGALINFALVLALTFWPSGEHEGPMPTSGETRRKPPEPLRSQGTASASAARIARATGTATGFGRRAF